MIFDFLLLIFILFVRGRLIFCCVMFVSQARASVHRFDVDGPSCFSSCEVASGAFYPKAVDVRRKARFQALATGLALREKLEG